MASPYHTLSVDGIIASNSHASSYAFIAAITIYLSIYFRRWFYASVLAYEVDREKYLLDRLYSVKNQKIDVLPPDINKSQVHFAPEGDNVRFGLADIKHVSVTAAEIILKNRPYANLFDFIMKTRSRIITKTVIVALISVGAFDFQTKERKRLLMLFESFWDKKGTSKVEEKLEKIFDEEKERLMNMVGLDTTDDDLVSWEKEYFGFRFFSSPFTARIVDAFRKLRAQNKIWISLSEVGSTPKRTPVFINSVRNHKDKNGNPMAFIEVEDVRGNRNTVPIFYSHFQYIRELISENSLYQMYLYSDKSKLFFGKKERLDDYAEDKRKEEAVRWLGKWPKT
jgi:DNA polymerase-3 subunit alpha